MELDTRRNLVNVSAGYQRVGVDGEAEGCHNATGKVIAVSAGKFECAVCHEGLHEHVGLRIDFQHTGDCCRQTFFFTDEDARSLWSAIHREMDAAHSGGSREVN